MRRPWGFIVLCALGGLAVPAAADDRAMCHNGGVSDADIAACSRLISSTLPANEIVRAYVRRCFLYGRRGVGDLERALADCNEVLRREPNNYAALPLRAAYYIRKGDLNRALADLTAADRIAPQNSGVRNVFGMYYLAKGDYDRALSEVNEAIRIAPANVFAVRNRGLIYEQKGQFEQALADFRVALQRDPGRTEYLGRESAEGIERIEKRRAALRPSPAPSQAPPPVAPLPVPEWPPPLPSESRVTPAPAPPPPPPPAEARVTPAPVSPAPPAPGPSDREPAGEAGKRVALVIANAAYPDADPPLTEPARHARTFADDLRRSGYEVEIGENLSKQGLRSAIDGFMAKITPSSVALLFFSGYGIQADRQTYLIPVDAQVWTERDVVRDGLKLETVLRDMNDRGAAGKLVIVDASRRNPYERRFRGVSVGLAPITTPPGSLVIYAASPGQVASEDSGIFVTELTKEIRAPGVTAEEAFIRTRVGVSNRTRNQQIPWVSSSLTGELKFARSR